MSAGTNRSIPTPVSVPNGGTGLAAGTSGGIPAFTATGTIASSGLLAANALMIGGGAGVVPSTTTTGAGVLTALGIAPNASGGFSTLRKFSGSASLTSFTAFGGSETSIAITVTGAVAGDIAVVNFPFSVNGIPTLGPVEVTADTVTAYIYSGPDLDGFYADSTWASGKTITAQITK